MQVVPNKIDSIEQVVPDRIFSVAFHPGGEKLVAGAGDKWGKVDRARFRQDFLLYPVKILPFVLVFIAHLSRSWSNG